MSGAAMLHTQQRHRDILRDYQQEFARTQANFTARKEREDLLRTVRTDSGDYKSNSGLNRRDMYAKESQHIYE